MRDVMLEIWIRIWDDITSGRHAPLAFRFVLQPAVAAFFAIRAGRQDARDGRSLYMWALVRDRMQRKALLREGWHHIGRSSSWPSSWMPSTSSFRCAGSIRARP